MKISIYWLRRDLRLKDNSAFHHALNSKYPVLPLFIFDHNIISELPKNDARISFIFNQLSIINVTLKENNSSLLVEKGDPIAVWKKIVKNFEIEEVYINRDYEPYALKRDQQVAEFLKEKGISLFTYKDQVIFEKSEITKDDNSPYTVYTPFKNKWLKHFTIDLIEEKKCHQLENLFNQQNKFPSLKDIGFTESPIAVQPFNLNELDFYAEKRDYPDADITSYLGPHLRFGTVSIRSIIRSIKQEQHTTFLSELIWREFFLQILYHFPHVVSKNFKPKYDYINWRNNEKEFELWCEGKTGYPMVDAGMRQLNETGYMHNRVRMVVAGFLCKHLLIDWRWGEAYFAKKLLDFDLASNNGNWQWAAGTGCDAAPYFRIFNPLEQLKKFDKQLKYIQKWVPEYNELTYPTPIVEHKFARTRALEAYKISFESFTKNS